MKKHNEWMNNKAKVGLTAREREVLALVADAWTYKQIAHRLHISTETVKSHLKNIYRKLEVSGKMEALKKFRPLK